jgi:putative acetyltransferase
MSTVSIRPIQPGDNPALAIIVRNALAEHHLDKPGTVFTDPTTDNLYELFNIPRAAYNVALLDGAIAGGAGIHPLDGGEPHVCELQKMYLVPAARGKGIARYLIEQCLEFARNNGYTHCYLETMPELAKARRLYEHFGFEYLDGPMGNTGHYACDNWMLKAL